MDLSNEDLIGVVRKLTSEKAELAKQLELSKVQNLISTTRLVLVILEDIAETYGGVPEMVVTLLKDALKALEK